MAARGIACCSKRGPSGRIVTQAPASKLPACTRVKCKPEVMPHALVLSDLANFRAVGDAEAIHFDVVEVARAFRLASHLPWAFSGTDPTGPVSELRFLGTGQNGLFA
jgi:hypothetical protein